MTKEEILDYITSTPENTNRRVLSDMIDELVNSSSGGFGDIVVVKCPITIEGDVWTATKTAGELWAADIIIWEVGDNWGKMLCQEKYYYNNPVDYVFLVNIGVNEQGQASARKLEAYSAEDYPTIAYGD